ncbi:hypothetical protein K1719_033147 [Acacia pycnantha]|nr:hypothetical protein K1719_033147 [Acacia pycnantha]
MHSQEERQTLHQQGEELFYHLLSQSGARYMIQNYQDAMAICAWVTEILSRIFNPKLHKLMRTLKDQKIFGSIKADVYTVEFQKRGLSHAHIILWLSESDKIRSSFEVDQVISAEIPDKLEDPEPV